MDVINESLVETGDKRVMTKKNLEGKQNKILVWIAVAWAATILTLFFTGSPNISKEMFIFFTYYCIMAFSLNLTSGTLGIVNFGVIAQVLVSAVIIGLLTVKLNVPIEIALILGILGSILFSGFIAFTSLKLRDDYFAIVSITLGEIFNAFLRTEPVLKTGSTGGIIGVPRPYEDFFRYLGAEFDNLVNNPQGDLLNFIPDQFFSSAFPEYFLGLIGVIFIILLYFLARRSVESPYGRVLKSIREDEVVTETYGKDVRKFKTQLIALSGLYTGVAGALLVWHRLSIYPESFQPLITFYIWTVFVLGGRGNNKGMIVGAMIFSAIFNLIQILNSKENIFYQFLESILPLINPFSERTVDLSSVFGNIQLMIVGVTLILLIYFKPKGLLEETPFEPDRPENVELEDFIV